MGGPRLSVRARAADLQRDQAHRGVKLILHALHESGIHVPEISIPFSLGFIVLVLAVTTMTSLRASKKQEEAERTQKAQAQA